MAGVVVRYGERRQEVLKMVMAERLRVFVVREEGKARTIQDLVFPAWAVEYLT